MSEDKDMGPFAGMAPEMVLALMRYGSPPTRKTIHEEVRDVGGYDFDEMPTTPSGWIDWMAQARAEAPAEYRDRLQCVLRYESDYDGSSSASLRVWFERPETDAEMIARVNQGIAHIQRRENDERRQYEALRAKYDAK